MYTHTPTKIQKHRNLEHTGEPSSITSWTRISIFLGVTTKTLMDSWKFSAPNHLKSTLMILHLSLDSIELLKGDVRTWPWPWKC
jgi:hypothetical protein